MRWWMVLAGWLATASVFVTHTSVARDSVNVEKYICPGLETKIGPCLLGQLGQPLPKERIKLKYAGVLSLALSELQLVMLDHPEDFFLIEISAPQNRPECFAVTDIHNLGYTLYTRPSRATTPRWGREVGMRARMALARHDQEFGRVTCRRIDVSSL